MIAGKDKGLTGKVLRIYPQDDRLVVEGVNRRFRHRKSRKSGQKGERIEIALPINTSNVMLICPHCGQPTRFGISYAGEKKVRQCKNCGTQI